VALDVDLISGDAVGRPAEEVVEPDFVGAPTRRVEVPPMPSAGCWRDADRGVPADEARMRRSISTSPGNQPCSSVGMVLT
jgi:hypothetical protein